MKGNNGKGNVSLRDLWETPIELFVKLDSQYSFKIDCCASVENSKTDRYYMNFESADKVIDMAWMNPPFSIAWRMIEHFFKVVSRGVMIYRCDNLETRLWQKIILRNADWIFIPNKRISYEGLDGEGARFPSALIGVGVDIPNTNDGTILYVKAGHQ